MATKKTKPKELHNCAKPCSDCPFRKNSAGGWLGSYENARELHDIVMTLEKPFPCHLTHTDKDLKWEDAGKKDFPICAGSLLYMRKAGKLPRDAGHAKLVKEADKNELGNILSVPEFFAHHDKTPAKKTVQKKVKANGERTAEEVEKELDKLRRLKEVLPETNFFGERTHLIIDLQMDILEGLVSDEDEIYNMVDEDQANEGDDAFITDSESTQILLAFQWLEKGVDELVDEKDLYR